MSPSEEPDRMLLDHLRRHGVASVGELGDLLGVTATAIRQRLNRLMSNGLIERQRRSGAQGGRGGGTQENRSRASQLRLPSDRAWPESCRRQLRRPRADPREEVRQIDDPAVRVGLIKRVAERLATRYASDDAAADVADRMRHLMRLMGEREVPVDVDVSGGLPVLTMLACPYPVLAEQTAASARSRR